MSCSTALWISASTSCRRYCASTCQRVILSSARRRKGVRCEKKSETVGVRAWKYRFVNKNEKHHLFRFFCDYLVFVGFNMNKSYFSWTHAPTVCRYSMKLSKEWRVSQVTIFMLRDIYVCFRNEHTNVDSRDKTTVAKQPVCYWLTAFTNNALGITTYW